jgi:hypothetical protein
MTPYPSTDKKREERSFEKPWKLKFAIFAGLLFWFWYQVMQQLGWFN